MTGLQPSLWVHACRVVGGTILAPGAVGVAVPLAFQKMIGYGDIVTAALALLALRLRADAAIALVWLVVAVGTVDTGDAIIQSMRYDVFSRELGVNWVIATTNVPAPGEQRADRFAAAPAERGADERTAVVHEGS